MRKLFLIAVMTIAASSLIFWGCQKEAIIEKNQYLTQLSTIDKTTLSIQEAKNWFEQKVENNAILRSDETSFVNSNLNWWFANELHLNNGSQKVISVPIKGRSTIFNGFPKNTFAELLIYRDSFNNLTSTNLFFIPLDPNQTNFLDKESFTGFVFTVNKKSSAIYINVLSEGEIVDGIIFNPTKSLTNATGRDEDEISFFWDMTGGSGDGSGGISSLPKWLVDLFKLVGCYTFPKGYSFGNSNGFGNNSGGNTSGSWNDYTNIVWINNKGNLVNYYFDNKSGSIVHVPTIGTGTSINTVNINSISTLFTNDFGKIMDIEDDCSQNNGSNFLSAIDKLSNGISVLELSFIQSVVAYLELKKQNNSISFNTVANEVAKVGFNWDGSTLLKPVKDKLPKDIFMLALDPKYSAFLKNMIQKAIEHHKDCLKKFPFKPKDGVSEATCSCFSNYDADFFIKDAVSTFDNIRKDYKISSFVAANPCLSSKANLNDASDQAILDVLANANGVSGNKLTPEENCKLFDLFKEFPGNDAIIDNLLTTGYSFEQISKIVNEKDIFNQTYTDENNGPPIDVNIPNTKACPLFNFVQSPELPMRFIVGINGLAFNLTESNGNISYTLPPLFITLPTVPLASGKSPQQALADAINGTVSLLQSNINSGILPPMTQYSIPPRRLKQNEWFLLLFNAALKTEYNGTPLGNSISGPGATVVQQSKSTPPTANSWGTGISGLQQTFNFTFQPVNSTCN